MARTSRPSRRRVAQLGAAVLVALGIGLVLVLVFRPETVTDVGPLDLPGIPDEPEAGEEVLVAVGDIGACSQEADEKVAELVDRLPGTIATLGDSVYPEFDAETAAACLEPAWGNLRDRIRPALGNHDYVGNRADAYFDWFGDAAGTPGEGWYAYTLGEWRIVVLNSMCGPAGGCGPGSAQYAWLEEELAANPSDCLLAYWHHPRYSSGRHGSDSTVAPLWEALVAAGVDVTLHGHDHTYEHVAADGVDSFVVGTGGRSLYRFGRDPLPTTVTRHDGSFGVLYLVLGDGGYTWEFLPLGVTTFSDGGEGEC